MDVVLREVVPADLDAFHEHQADPVAAAMAVFPSRSRAEVEAHWSRILADETLWARTVLCDGEVAGNVVSWPSGERRLVGYWIGRAWWGRGVATAALSAALRTLPPGPLAAFVAVSNVASIRVLERCGFVRSGPPVTGDDGVAEYEYVLRERVTLRPYGLDDLPVLVAGNTPELQAFLGGVEPMEKVEERHARYAAMPPETAHVFVILVDDVPAGSIVWWPREWRGENVYEAGWKVLTPFAGRGVATRALRLALGDARADGRHRYVHAFPRVDNVASNALCRRTGFELLGECDFEYPAGTPIRSNDWRYDLHP